MEGAKEEEEQGNGEVGDMEKVEGREEDGGRGKMQGGRGAE